jgi:hypothetical protein
MATKIKMLKLLQEQRGFAEMGWRHPAPKTYALYLMQLRSHGFEAGLPKRKLIIPVILKDSPDIPHPVKITHLIAGNVEEIKSSAV